MDLVAGLNTIAGKSYTADNQFHKGNTTEGLPDILIYLLYRWRLSLFRICVINLRCIRDYASDRRVCAEIIESMPFKVEKLTVNKRSTFGNINHLFSQIWRRYSTTWMTRTLGTAIRLLIQTWLRSDLSEYVRSSTEPCDFTWPNLVSPNWSAEHFRN